MRCTHHQEARVNERRNYFPIIVANYLGPFDPISWQPLFLREKLSRA